MPNNDKKKPLPPSSLGKGAAAIAAKKAQDRNEKLQKQIDEMMGYRPNKIK